MQLQDWEHLFKPEIRNSGSVLFRKDKVTLRQPSDTEIQAYVQGMGAIKLSLKCTAVESPTAIAKCSCPQAAKGQACKHIWAMLLAAIKKFPDFFESKTDLEFTSVEELNLKNKTSDRPASDNSANEISKTWAKAVPKATPKAASRAFSKASGSDEYKEKQKAKQAEYRKQQYEKQKLYAKQNAQKRKLAKAPAAEPAPYPPEVEQALKFFIENGAAIGDTLDGLSIGSARKKLARIFHPDLGGSHEKMVQLTSYTNTLMKFVGA